MKKSLFIIAIITLTLMGLAVAAVAVDDTWSVQFRPYHGTLTAGTLTLGTKPGASDIWIMSEDAVFPDPPTNGAAEIFSTLIPRIPGGRTSTDWRAPLNMTTRTELIWDLSMDIVGGQPGTITLYGWAGSGANMLDSSLLVRLYLGSTPIWTIPSGTSGTQADPQWSRDFFYTGTPIEFQLVAEAVPEPSSVVAMLGGILGLVGFSIRRRI